MEIKKEKKVEKQDNFEKMTKEQLVERIKFENDIKESLIKENEALIAEQKEFATTIEKYEAYRDQIVSLKSDFDNFKRRNSDVAKDSNDEGKIFVIEKLLPVLDTFERAKVSLDEKALQSFLLVLKQFEKILQEVGVVEVDVLNAEFDPNLSNAVQNQAVVKDEDKNKVLEVFSKGYKYKDKIVRYSQVKVGN